MPRTLLVRDYLLLGLRLDRLVPGTVDAYTGDPALRRHAATGPQPGPADLARTAARLRSELPHAGLGAARTAFLDAQLGAVTVTARRLAGEPVGFVEEVRSGYGVTIRLGDEDRYRAAHAALDGLLPGPGRLAERLTAFRDREAVPLERLGPAIAALAAALRARTRDAFGLPDGEAVSFQVVRDRPWSGFTRYDGRLRSTIAVNADAGLRGSQLADLVAHEAYPGHHTEHCLVRGRPGPDREHDIALATTPQALMSEGAADVGLEVLVGPGWGQWAADVLAEAGVGSDGALAEAVETVLRELAPVRQDAALMLHDRGASADDVLGHLARWLLIPDARARLLLRFLAHPLWRTYTTTYVEGAPLVRRWLARGGADPLDGYRRLLAEPLVPTMLAAGCGPQLSRKG